LVGCCVIPCRRSHQNSRLHFFRPSIRHPKRWANVLPHAFRPFASPLQSSPPPPTPSFSWLSRFPFEWRPPKTGAPPITQFVDGRHSGAPNKCIEGSAREPRRWAPLLGSWRAAAPLFGSMVDDAMEREGKAAGGRVAAAHPVCVCCVCLFFLFVFR
jgi:hypothetical protein